MSDPDLIELARQLTHTAEANYGHNSSDPPVQPPLLPTERSGVMTPSSPAKEVKTADELAAMIYADLSKVEGCPKRGVKVAVYGSNPWNSWLSFGTESGPVPNRVDLQTFCEIITERLKRLYDIPG